MTQWSPMSTASVVPFEASDPALGSVRQNAPILCPFVSIGRYFCFCSSLPYSMIGPQHNPLWVATMSPVEAHCLLSSSTAMAQEISSAPAPPYSLGTPIPMTP